jgi:hypothetical protein
MDGRLLAKNRVAQLRPLFFLKISAESIDQLLVHCRFTQTLWGLLKEWLGLYFLNLHRHTMSLYLSMIGVAS